MKTPAKKSLISKRYAGILIPLLPIVLILAAYVLYPVFRISIKSLTFQNEFSLKHFADFFTSTASLKALWGSIGISLLSVLFSALVGIPLAYLFNHYNFPGKKLFGTLAILPIVMPPLVGVLAFLFLYGESGILPRALQEFLALKSVPFSMRGITAILVVHTYSMYVYFYLFSLTFFNELDSSVLEASQNLGAGRFMTITRIILPMMTPALAGASLLVFMTSMASFSAPFIFADKFPVLSLEIYNSKLNGNLEMAVTQSVVLTAISVLFLILFRSYSTRRQYVGGGKGVRLTPKVITKGWQRILLGIFGMTFIIILVLPLFTVILMSFVKNGTWTWQTLPPSYTLENYKGLFKDPKIIEPILNSLKMASIATVANVIFGVAAAYLIVRRKFVGKGVVEILTMLPWAIPGTVIAIALIVTFNRPSFITGGQILVGTFWLLPMAYFIRNLPLVFRSSVAALEQFEPSLEEAARNLGASWWYAFRRVMLPSLAPGIISGALLAFVLALGEFVSSILLYTYHNRPISVEIISQLRIFNLGSAAAYSVFLILIITAVVVSSNRFLGQRSGRLVV